MVRYSYNNNKRGQIFSLDLIIAMLMFIVVIILIFQILDYSNNKIGLEESANDISIIAGNAISSLTETEGNPNNWSLISLNDFNESNVFSLGLAKNSNFNNQDSSVKGKSMSSNNNGYIVLDKNKISRLSSLNNTKYNEIRNILGIKGPGYEFLLSVKNWNGNSYDTIKNIGRYPDDNAGIVVKKNRMGLIENNITLVEFRVWKR